MVLRPLALSLLIPERHYRVVSAHVERTRLADQLGRGQRLVYLRVGKRQRNGTPAWDAGSLPDKLQFREGHALLPWLKEELNERFGFQCCDSVDQFQAARGLALTKNRHVKMGRIRHEKDDRERSSNPKFFLLVGQPRKNARVSPKKSLGRNKTCSKLTINCGK